jgi:SagB-type dehydrogenase family enzyme
MAPGDTARLYHRLSSYLYPSEDEWPIDALPPPIDHPLVVQDFVPLDRGRFPASYKAYEASLPTVDLPRTWPIPDAAATAVLGGVGAARPTPPDLASLARLLHLSAGIVRVSDRSGHHWLFRAAGSAGGRFPLEVYVSARGVAGLPDGVHWYDPAAHALLRVGPPAEGGNATTIVVTAVPWRTAWKYAERGLRHAYWDAGTMLAQTLTLAESAGHLPRLWTTFPDADVARLVGADGDHEFPVGIVGLGDGAPAITPAGPAVAGELDADSVEFPLVTTAHHAGDRDSLGDPWPAPPPLDAPLPPSADLDTVALQRGSARILDAGATIGRDAFEYAVAASLRGSRVPHVIAVHAVDGMEPGLYRPPDLERPFRAGRLREELFRVCLEMAQGRDAAFVDLAIADLAAVDDRGYRDAQIDSGIAEGRYHLAAYALGIGATGMTFLDDEVGKLLGERWSGLLLTCVGVPTYRTTPGGPPGKPSTVVIPNP